MINFLNLEYFLAAAEELNFTRAAKRLYISQQSLSNHISNMEKEFDVVLFIRLLGGHDDGSRPVPDVCQCLDAGGA